MASAGITKPGESPKSYAPFDDPKGCPVIIDSGTTGNLLPPSLVDAIVADFPGAAFQSANSFYLVDCAFAGQDGTLDFGFRNTIIHVLYHEFIWQAGGECYLPIINDERVSILGGRYYCSVILTILECSQMSSKLLS